ncbi:MAG: SDR family oxidoreductase [Bacteroidota bacterium]
MIKEKFSLEGKVAIITGASKGIGKAIARGLAEFGAKVVISSRKQAAVDTVAAEFEKEGLEATAIACHVADEAQCQILVQGTLDKYGRIDILVNNAGTNPYYGAIEKMPKALYQKTMDVNLNAAIYLSNLVHPYLKQQGRGSIIHISSIEGFHATAFMSAYNVSKAALIMLGKNQAIEWGKDNIRVNVICPGYVRTKLAAGFVEDAKTHQKMMDNTPLGRVATPDEIAGMAVYLASEASSFCTGSAMVVDGGLLNAPLF